MRVSLSANLLSWLTRAIHSWSSWLPTPSPVVRRQIYIINKRVLATMLPFYPNLQLHWRTQAYSSTQCVPSKQELVWNMKKSRLTFFVFLLVLFFALFTGWLALRGLRSSCLSSTTRAPSWEWWRGGGGAGQHLTATQGTGEQLQKHRGNTLIH